MGRQRAGEGRDGAARAVAVRLFAAALAIALLQAWDTSPGPQLQGAEMAHAELLGSFVSRGELTVPALHVDAAASGERTYSNKPPGFDVVVLPVALIHAALLRREYSPRDALLDAKIVSAFLSAAAITFAFLFLVSLRLGTPAALWGATAAGVGTLFFAYDTLATSIPLSAALFFAAAFALARARAGGADAWTWLATFCVSWAFVTDFKSAFYLLPLAAVLAREALGSARRATLAAVVALPPLVLLGAYNAAAFGTPFVLSYSHSIAPPGVDWSGVADAFSLRNVPQGLFGLLVGPARGALVLSPIIVFAPAAISGWRGSPRAPAAVAFASALAGIVGVSAYSMWHGGHCVGYRHIVVPVACLAALTAVPFARWRSAPARAALVAALVISIASSLLAYRVQNDPGAISATWDARRNSQAGFYSELVPRICAPAFARRAQRRDHPRVEFVVLDHGLFARERWRASRPPRRTDSTSFPDPVHGTAWRVTFPCLRARLVTSRKFVCPIRSS